jgi:glycosyltransferase involved in cell wall biosynthesis
MKILFYTPYYHQPRGNATTAKRLVRLMKEKGVALSVCAYQEEEPPAAEAYDLVHILHVTRFLHWAKEKGLRIKSPYIVTMGGTDINVDLQGSPTTKEIFRFLDTASYITVFTEDAKEKVRRLHDDWESKTHVIPQSAWMPQEAKKMPTFLAPHILLPAGLRSIKDVLHTLPALDQLIIPFPHLQFTIIGAKLDGRIFEQVKEACRTRPWMHYADPVPHDQMMEWYDKADIVINSSISEGQSIALMEAMTACRPIIGRTNKANESLIQHGKTGWLYDDKEDFVRVVHEIMQNSYQRQQIVQLAKKTMDRHYSSEAEVTRYLELYTTCIKTHKCESEI